MGACECCHSSDTDVLTVCVDCETLHHAYQVNEWVWRELEHKILQTHYRTHDRSQKTAAEWGDISNQPLEGYLDTVPAQKRWVVRKHPELEWLACRTSPAIDFYREHPEGLHMLYPKVSDLDWTALLS